MLVNRIINVTEDFGSGDIDEPVSLSQAKEYLRLQGWTDEDDSGEQDFDYDDLLIQSFITEGRMWVEKYTGQYLVPRTLTVVFMNQAGGIELPGPVYGSPVFTNWGSVDITDKLRMVGSSVITGWAWGWPNVRVVEPSHCSPEDDYITAVYEAGYTDVPDWAENAIKAYVAFAFENRGDGGAQQFASVSVTNPDRAAAICRAYRKQSAWA